MYGVVHTLEETFNIIGLSKKRVLVENENTPEKEKIEKKRLIEEARRQRQATMTETKPKTEPKKDEASKSRTTSLFEEIQSLDKEFRNILSENTAPAVSKDMEGVVASLSHVMNFSADAVKKYEWRQDDRSKKIASLFKAIHEEARGMCAKVKKGEITEESVARQEVNPLVKRFVESVQLVKDGYKLNETVLAALKESLKNVK